MKKLFISLLLLLPFWLFFSCSTSTSKNITQANAYFFSSDNSGNAIPITVNLSSLSENAMVSELFSLLSSPEESKKLVPMIGKSTKIQNVAVSDGLCSLTMSPHYNSLSDPERATANTCIVKSLCSLPFVDKVAITCENSYEVFSDDDFILTSPVTSYEKLMVNLYYVDLSHSNLICNTQEITILPDKTLEEDVVSRLLIPPPGESNMISGFPPGTRLNNVYVSENCCFIDVSPEFFLNASHEKSHEKASLFSIVNTMTELPMINSVKFLIDGQDGYGYTYYNIAFPLNNSQDFSDNN